MRGKFFILCLLFIFPAGSNLAQWTKLNNPEILIPLYTSAVASKGDTLFVGTYRSTIYRSFDGGTTWTRSDSGISNIQLTNNLLITDNIVFAMGEYGVYRSTDWGKSWELKDSGLHLGDSLVYEMVKLNNLLFAATGYGVYSSSDNGDNWTSTTGVSSFWPLYSITALDGNLFVGTEVDGVYYSNDNGHTWNEANTGLPKTPTYIVRIDKVYADGGNLYAGLNGSGIYLSTNNGNSWLPDTTGLGNDGYYLYPIYSLAKIGNYLYAGTQYGGIYRKNDTENSWTVVNSGLPENSYAQSIVLSIIENKGRIFAATSHGLYSSSINNINWSPIFTKYPATVMTTDLITSGNHNIFLGGESYYYSGEIYGICSSSDGGNSWFAGFCFK